MDPVWRLLVQFGKGQEAVDAQAIVHRNDDYAFSRQPLAVIDGDRPVTVGDTDQPGFGGGSVQDSNNMKAEKSIASFDVKHRAIISCVLDLPFGNGHRWLNGGGVANAVAGGWQVNGITTLQSGFPYSFTYNSPNTNLFVSGNTLSNTWGGGAARPDILPGCNLNTSGSYLSKFLNNNFFNAACIVPPGTTNARDQ